MNLQKSGFTPAHIAAEYDATGEKLKAIVEACPDCIDVQDMWGNTLLHRAASDVIDGIVKSL